MPTLDRPMVARKAKIVVTGEIMPPATPIPAEPNLVSRQPRMAARALMDEMGPEADPLRLMLQTIKNTEEPIDRRLDCAKAAAPFIYPKLGAIAVADTSEKSFADLLLELKAAD